jgi:hypothetical protein
LHFDTSPSEKVDSHQSVDFAVRQARKNLPLRETAAEFGNGPDMPENLPGGAANQSATASPSFGRDFAIGGRQSAI